MTRKQLLTAVWASLLAPSKSLAWQPMIHPKTQSFVSQSYRLTTKRSLFSSGRQEKLICRGQLDRQQYLRSNHKLHLSNLSYDAPRFRPGDSVMVEVISFGPLGASVEVIGIGHDSQKIISVEEDPYGTGLILQKEISYFRQSRENVDVVRGEILPAYVQNVREDGKIDIGLRVYGGKAKSQEVATMIMEQLKLAPDGILNIGDKSPPAEINKVLPGVSKSSFKKAVGGLFKQGLITPSPNSITLN